MPQPRREPPRGRVLVGWVTALAALGAASALLAGTLWLVRLPLATFFIGAALAERGVDADFEVAAIDLRSATLANVRFGDAAFPDAEIKRIEVRWRWRGGGPALSALRLVEPSITMRLQPDGRISAGSLARIGGEPGAQRPSLPPIALEIVAGRAHLDAPFGRLEAAFDGAGVLGRDFTAAARVTQSSLSSDGYELRAGAAMLDVTSKDQDLVWRLDAGAAGLRWDDARLEVARLQIVAHTPLDLARLDVAATWRARVIAAGGVRLDDASGRANLSAQSPDDRLGLAQWSGVARALAQSITTPGASLHAVRCDLRANGDGGAGRAGWTLDGQAFSGAGLTARPNAAGDVALAPGGALSGQARVTLAGARLTEHTARTLGRLLPAAEGAPVAPTFAQARRAFAAAGRAFELSAPLSWDLTDDRLQIRMSAATARAANGMQVSVAALRNDTPAFTLQWPGASLHAAISAQVSGGGAPRATLLLDSLDWAPDAPVEAEGALTITQWSAGGASIATDELNFAMALPPGGGGGLDLRGPAQVTGPVGDGWVEDMRADLDVAIAWGQGWRVTSNSGCVPTRFAALDVAALSLTSGAFSLCANGDALVAANRRGQLSGGFAVSAPMFAGRMSLGEPARVAARTITGRFGGAGANAWLSLAATAPRLNVALSPSRSVDLSLAQLSADVRFGADWRIDGAFAHGVLADPALPGEVTAIAGAWRASTEQGRMVVAVEAGEALVTAQPASEAELPLFNPIRLLDVGAVLRQGRIDAQGAVVLEDGGRRLAQFTAAHEVAQGQGQAHVSAENLLFDENFQPSAITRRSVGIAENVRGGADFAADVIWRGQRTIASGMMRLNGVSLATATIPIVENVRGEIAFDDLFALTTPPGQRLSIDLVNPGVAVRDGFVQFQLLGDQRVAIEAAEFAYAGGVLAMAPTTITLGGEETRFELRLADVEAADLIQSLAIPDLTATGRVEGSFPLVLSRRAALVERGVLRALPGGGAISYVGHVGEGATGAARVAFDALRSFRYDDLEIRLDGDLGGEVVSSIAFSGRNTGEPVDLGPIAPMPGLGNVRVLGVPFAFNVHVTAPFRRLAQTVASVTDPGVILERGAEADPETPVDHGSENPR